MKKLLALVLSMLLVASCFAMISYAEEETTAAEETTVAEGEETTEEAPSYSNTKIVFDENAKAMKILGSQNGLNKTFYKAEEWEGARLKVTKPEDPYVAINFNQYIKKAGLEKLDSQSYPYIVFKLKVEGYIDDIELFYCAGDVTGATGGFSTTTDFPGMYDGSVEYIIYDLTGDCEGNYNMFRFDPMGADDDTLIFLYEMAFFATEEEAIAYAGFDQEPEIEETEPVETEAPTTEKETEAPTTEAVSRPERGDKAEDKGCGGIISVGAFVALIALGVVCIKKKD